MEWNIIQPHDDINGSCLSLALNRGNELRRLVQWSIGKRIPFKDVKDKVPVTLPSLEEQTQIAELSGYCESLSEDSEVIDRAFVNLKSLLLHVMFPH